MNKARERMDAVKLYLERDSDEGEMAASLWSEFGTTRAVMVLDSTGFTRTTRARGIVFFLTVIVRLREVAMQTMREHNALSCRAEADNVYAHFETVDDAVSAAAEIHEKLERGKIMIAENEGIGACIGIGYGKMLLSEHEGLYGDEMNLASKLGEDTAEGGETLITENALANLSMREKLKIEQRAMTVSGVSLPYYALKMKA